MKPVRAARLADALRKAAAEGAPRAQRLAQAGKGPREYLSVLERNRTVLVPVREIVHLRAELKYVTLRTRSGEHLIEEPLVALEAEFAEHFVRVHRSCLVARAAVRGFERAAQDGEEPHWNVVLEGIAERLPVRPAPMGHGARAGEGPPLNRLRIATRRSRLALWQAEHVKARLQALHAGLAVELVPLSTRGDELIEERLDKVFMNF